MELTLQSNLSMQQIEDNFKNVDFFSGVMEGLEEALAYEKGSARAATRARKRELPNIDVASMRKDLELSQKSFASILGVSIRTVEAWETGRSNPTPTARNLMFLISLDKTLIHKLQK
jgi:putative transcriptional regulator